MDEAETALLQKLRALLTRWDEETSVFRKAPKGDPALSKKYRDGKRAAAYELRNVHEALKCDPHQTEGGQS